MMRRVMALSSAVNLLAILICFIQLQHSASSINCYQCVGFDVSTGLFLADVALGEFKDAAKTALKTFNVDDECATYHAGILKACSPEEICHSETYTLKLTVPLVGVGPSLTVSNKFCKEAGQDRNNCEENNKVGGLDGEVAERIGGALASVKINFETVGRRFCYCDSDGCDKTPCADGTIYFSGIDECFKKWKVGAVVCACFLLFIIIASCVCCQWRKRRNIRQMREATLAFKVDPNTGNQQNGMFPMHKV